MKIALVHDHYSIDHLAEVTAEMRTRGAPTIHAVWMECYQMYAAIEGCHRLRAAHALGLTPEILEVDYSDNMLSSISGYDGDADYPISSIADDCFTRTILDF